jgi:hypothetical protein
MSCVSFLAIAKGKLAEAVTRLAHGVDVPSSRLASNIHGIEGLRLFVILFSPLMQELAQYLELSQHVFIPIHLKTHYFVSNNHLILHSLSYRQRLEINHKHNQPISV